VEVFFLVGYLMMQYQECIELMIGWLMNMEWLVEWELAGKTSPVPLCPPTHPIWPYLRSNLGHCSRKTFTRLHFITSENVIVLGVVITMRTSNPRRDDNYSFEHSISYIIQEDFLWADIRTEELDIFPIKSVWSVMHKFTPWLHCL
jgi:hypothetical protein